jgi:hypothetical protein
LTFWLFISYFKLFDYDIGLLVEALSKNGGA